jgi:hypothetical protein
MQGGRGVFTNLSLLVGSLAPELNLLSMRPVPLQKPFWFSHNFRHCNEHERSAMNIGAIS